jgi:hypothetical protein
MSRLLQVASAAAITLTATVAIALTVPGFAQESDVQSVTPGEVVFEPAQPAPAAPTIPQTPLSSQNDIVDADPVVVPAPELIAVPRGVSLTRAVRDMAHAEPDNAEMRCLASGIYYESRAESLEGQLAVAHVIIDRSTSGRFARSICGVLTQRGQFSFVRGGVVPQPANNAQWRTSVAVARVAMNGDHASPVPGALFFHATRVSPGWNRPRVATVGNHVFYR